MPKLTRTFTRDQLDDWGVPFECGAFDGAAVDLHVEQTATRRWVSVHRLIFRAPDDGKVYAVHYEQGLTEHQDAHDPWGSADEIQATAVEERQVTVTQWLPVEAP